MRLSQPQKVFEFLKSKPLQQFTAREIAEAIVKNYPSDYAEKRSNTRFATEAEFINQIVAEIGGQKNNLLKLSPHIHLQDKPRPRLYWFNSEKIAELRDDIKDIDIVDENIEIPSISKSLDKLTEHDLYPILIEFLKAELGLYCLRIDEKRSKNLRGQNGNQWLHPDIVSMQPIDKQWNELIKTCVKHSSGQNVRL